MLMDALHVQALALAMQATGSSSPRAAAAAAFAYETEKDSLRVRSAPSRHLASMLITTSLTAVCLLRQSAYTARHQQRLQQRTLDALARHGDSLAKAKRDLEDSFGSPTSTPGPSPAHSARNGASPRAVSVARAAGDRAYKAALGAMSPKGSRRAVTLSKLPPHVQNSEVLTPIVDTKSTHGSNSNPPGDKTLHMDDVTTVSPLPEDDDLAGAAGHNTHGQDNSASLDFSLSSNEEEDEGTAKALPAASGRKQARVPAPEETTGTASAPPSKLEAANDAIEAHVNDFSERIQTLMAKFNPGPCECP